MIRFCLHPGEVISRNDFDRHYISADQLCWLYRVNPRECLVWHDEWGVVGYTRDFLACLLHLYPLSGPDYRPVSDRERRIYPLPQPSRATERAMGRLTLMERLESVPIPSWTVPALERDVYTYSVGPFWEPCKIIGPLYFDRAEIEYRDGKRAWVNRSELRNVDGDRV